MSSTPRRVPGQDHHAPAPDPALPDDRITAIGNGSGGVMRTVFLSLVMGSRGSGVSTLLEGFARRADMAGTLILDDGQSTDGDLTLPLSWRADDLDVWLAGLASAAHDRAAWRHDRIVMAADDLSAPRRLLHALAAANLPGVAARLDGVTLAIAADGACDPLGDDRLKRAAAIADRIVLTKADRQDPSTVKQLAGRLKALNPPAPVLTAKDGDLGPARLVDSGLFDPITRNIDIDRWLCEAAYGWETSRRAGGRENAGSPSLQKPIAARGFRSFAVTLDQPISSTVLTVFLKFLMAERGADLLRLKGIIATAEHPDRPALLDGTEHVIQPLFWLPRWPTADHRSRLVFVTTEITEQWIRALLATLCDQIAPAQGITKAREPALQMAMLTPAAS
jgi:G3E family GTPase